MSTCRRLAMSPQKKILGPWVSYRSVMPVPPGLQSERLQPAPLGLRAQNLSPEGLWGEPGHTRLPPNVPLKMKMMKVLHPSLQNPWTTPENLLFSLMSHLKMIQGNSANPSEMRVVNPTICHYPAMMRLVLCPRKTLSSLLGGTQYQLSNKQLFGRRIWIMRRQSLPSVNTTIANELQRLCMHDVSQKVFTQETAWIQPDCKSCLVHRPAHVPLSALVVGSVRKYWASYMITWYPFDFDTKTRCKEGLLQTVHRIQRAGNISWALLEIEQAGSRFHCALLTLCFFYYIYSIFIYDYMYGDKAYSI